MLKKCHRLTKNRHFQYIYRKGQSKQCANMGVVYARTFVQPFKVGFSVSKKIGKSVVRSRVKRLMSAATEQFLHAMHNGYNYIFFAKPEITKLSLEEIKAEMKKLLIKANLCFEE